MLWTRLEVLNHSSCAVQTVFSHIKADPNMGRASSIYFPSEKGY